MGLIHDKKELKPCLAFPGYVTSFSIASFLRFTLLRLILVSDLTEPLSRGVDAPARFPPNITNVVGRPGCKDDPSTHA